MGQGNYDHPSYLTRQQINLGKTTAGSAGTTILYSPTVSNMRIRQVAAAVVVAGTNTGANTSAGSVTLFAYSTNTGATGTASIGIITPGANARLTPASLSGDLNYTLNTGFVLGAVNGTDAQLSVQLTAEMYIDPSSTWTGQN